jgi:serine/threonine protein kinase
MAGRPPGLGLSLGLKKPAKENNENEGEGQGGPIVTPAKEDGPLKVGETLEDMFPGKSNYRSEVFFKIQRGERTGIRKIARRGKFGNWRDDIFRTTVKELGIYKRIAAHEGWRQYILPFAGGGLLDKESVIYLDFDYIEGLDLIDYSKKATKAHQRSVLAQVARALKWCLEAGFSHGDIKPDNIHIEEVRGEPKARLFDFGEATVDPRSGPMKEDLQAYIQMCTEVTHVTKKELLTVLDVGNSNNAVNGPGLADAYDRLAHYWSSLAASAPSHQGGRRGRSRRQHRKQKATRKTSI